MKQVLIKKGWAGRVGRVPVVLKATLGSSLWLDLNRAHFKVENCRCGTLIAM